MKKVSVIEFTVPCEYTKSAIKEVCKYLNDNSLPTTQKISYVKYIAEPGDRVIIKSGSYNLSSGYMSDIALLHKESKIISEDIASKLVCTLDDNPIIYGDVVAVCPYENTNICYVYSKGRDKVYMFKEDCVIVLTR